MNLLLLNFTFFAVKVTISQGNNYLQELRWNSLTANIWPLLEVKHNDSLYNSNDSDRVFHYNFIFLVSNYARIMKKQLLKHHV